jgi:hypothetical protein
MSEEGTAPQSAPGDGLLRLAAIASLGAGAIHAAAIGAHAGERQTVLTFLVAAVVQLGWGALALVRRERALVLLGAAANAALVAGWAMAKTSGISFIDGLEATEPVQLADGAAAGLAAVAALSALASTVARVDVLRALPARAALTVGLVGLTVAGLNTTGNHSHTHGEEGHDHGTEELADGHSHDHGSSAGGGTTSTTHAHPSGGDDVVHVEAKPYDPAKPIDLSGTPGVSPAQQAAAENIIAVTLADLPRWADPATAEADGFRSIGDGLTGYEHYINWTYLNDGKVLDPDHPESLVYKRQGDGKQLVSAMFMLEPGSTLDDVPELGGPLTQWHIHDDLCFTDDPVQPRVAAITSVGGTCQAPLKKFEPVPMIHVWITPHPCGPFAALEGVAAGQIKPGEERLCDHEHGTG